MSKEKTEGSKETGSRFLLDMRQVPVPERHPTFLERFESLEPGQSLTLVNDHDPKPLFYEMQAEQDAFDDENYASYEAADGVYVAVFPTETE